MAVPCMSEIVRTREIQSNELKIEGIFTILVGIAFLTIFPTSISKPVSLVGIRFFSERESHILTRRILADDPSKAEVKTYVSWQEVKNVVSIECLKTMSVIR